MHVVNRNDVPPFTTKDTSTIREILAPANSGILRQSLAEATLAAGACTQAHFHPDTEEIYCLLEGEALMAVEGEQQLVVSGDAIAILPGQRHQIRNTGASDLVFLCCCVPAYTDADTVMCESLIQV